MKLTLYLMAGSALILAGILGIYFAAGARTFDLDRLVGAAIDARLDAIVKLKRKYGDSVAAILAHRHETAAALERITRHDEIAAEMERAVAAPVDLLVQGVCVARGEVVVVGDRFAVRITELSDAKRRPER